MIFKCDECSGSGVWHDGTQCPECKGRGFVPVVSAVEGRISAVREEILASDSLVFMLGQLKSLEWILKKVKEHGQGTDGKKAVDSPVLDGAKPGESESGTAPADTV